MPTQFDFLEKHYIDSDNPTYAAQDAIERFSLYPDCEKNTLINTLIYNIKWDCLRNLVEEAVINYTWGNTYPAQSFAYLGEYNHHRQWNIILTNLNYINAEKQKNEILCTKYINGTIIVCATVEGTEEAPLLGEIVHLQTAIGRADGVIVLKNKSHRYY